MELASTQRHDEAVRFFLRALSLNARLPDVHVHLGNSLLALGRDADARQSFEAALSISPGCAAAYNGLGALESRASNLDLAVVHFRNALAHDSRFADAEYNLGYTLAELGDMEGAVRCLRRAIELEPRNPRNYRVLLAVDSERLEEPDVERLERLAERIQKLTRSQRVELHFALGQIYAAKDRSEEAFAHYEAGNKEKRRDVAYDEPRQIAFMQKLQSAMTPALTQLLREAGDPSDRPIFVFGMPRSGTTLIAQIFAAHPDVKSAGELKLFDSLLRQYPPLEPSASVERLRSTMSELGRRYLDEIERFADGRPRVVDKTLSNFMLAPLINAALPNARMVHVFRDPLDTCWSCYTTLFADTVAFAYDLGELGRYYRTYQRMMASWRNLLPADRLLEVRYEDVVNDFPAQVRRISDFCGLAWNPACLEFHKAKRAVRTASLSQVRQPLYQTSVGRAEQFRGHLGELVTVLEDPGSTRQ